MFGRKKKKREKVDWVKDPEILVRVHDLADKLHLDWIQTDKIYAIRSTGSAAKAYARIWGMSRVWQIAANLPAVYCIEVVSQYFDKLSVTEQDKVLLHELAHIPKNFSGALVAHNHTKGGFHDKLHEMLADYKKLKN